MPFKKEHEKTASTGAHWGWFSSRLMVRWVRQTPRAACLICVIAALLGAKRNGRPGKFAHLKGVHG